MMVRTGAFTVTIYKGFQLLTDLLTGEFEYPNWEVIQTLILIGRPLSTLRSG